MPKKTTLKKPPVAKAAGVAVTATGFTQHTGKKCPVDADTIVTVQMRDGSEWTGAADGVFWRHRDQDDADHKRDVIAYKVA